MDSKNNKIKNVVFDLGNVVLAATPAIVLDDMNLTRERYSKIKSKFFTNWDKLDLGYETLEEHLKASNLNVTLQERERLINYYKYRPFNTHVISLMRTLKDKGYGIYILSNNNKQASEYLKSLYIFKFVDGFIMSCDYNIIKPDKRIYQKLFSQFNLNPNECFFVDDKVENIEAGKELGMPGYVMDADKQDFEQLVTLIIE